MANNHPNWHVNNDPEPIALSPKSSINRQYLVVIQVFYEEVCLLTSSEQLKKDKLDR